jgi:hypothetical protein
MKTDQNQKQILSTRCLKVQNSRATEYTVLFNFIIAHHKNIDFLILANANTKIISPTNLLLGGFLLGIHGLLRLWMLLGLAWVQPIERVAIEEGPIGDRHQCGQNQTPSEY